MTSPPFKFRLERVRALRERTEDLAKEDYAAALSHRLAGEAMLRVAHDRVRQAGDALRGTTAAHADVAQLAAVQAYIERSESHAHAAAVEKDRREELLSGRRAALTQASRDRQVLDRLRDRRRAAHAVHTARLDGAIQDELAAGVHRRQVTAR